MITHKQLFIIDPHRKSAILWHAWHACCHPCTERGTAWTIDVLADSFHRAYVATSRKLLGWSPDEPTGYGLNRTLSGTHAMIDCITTYPILLFVFSCCQLSGMNVFMMTHCYLCPLRVLLCFLVFSHRHSLLVYPCLWYAFFVFWVLFCCVH